MTVPENGRGLLWNSLFVFENCIAGAWLFHLSKAVDLWRDQPLSSVSGVFSPSQNEHSNDLIV